jgi:hypothetical protein
LNWQSQRGINEAATEGPSRHAGIRVTRFFFFFLQKEPGRRSQDGELVLLKVDELIYHTVLSAAGPFAKYGSALFSLVVNELLVSPGGGHG